MGEQPGGVCVGGGARSRRCLSASVCASKDTCTRLERGGSLPSLEETAPSLPEDPGSAGGDGKSRQHHREDRASGGGAESQILGSWGSGLSRGG